MGKRNTVKTMMMMMMMVVAKRFLVDGKGIVIKYLKVPEAFNLLY
jgi:hypothetical protein